MPLPHSLSSLRIALVYDWVTTQHGGAEWVLQTLLAAFPTLPCLRVSVHLLHGWNPQEFILLGYKNCLVTHTTGCTHR